MVLIINLQNLQQENSTLLMTKIMDNMAEEMKMIQPLHLKQKSFYKMLKNINDEHVETAENVNIIMPMHNFLDYSDIYAESSGSLNRFKR